MQIAITMTAWKRPHRTRQTLAALAKCRGIADCVFIPNIEPGRDDVIEQFRAWDHCAKQVAINDARLGVNRNTAVVLTRARQAKVDAVIHLDDDTALTPDALEFFRWGFSHFADDDLVFSIGAYSRPAFKPSPEQSHECRLRATHNCLAWGTWRNRLTHMLVNWCYRNPSSYRKHINETRGDRLQLYPVLSRVQCVTHPPWRNKHRVSCTAERIANVDSLFSKQWFTAR